MTRTLLLEPLTPDLKDEMRAALDCDPDALHRLLRAAATFGAVRMGRDGRVRATRLTRRNSCGPGCD